MSTEDKTELAPEWPIINAAATLTKLGGSIMHPRAVKAMVRASTHFVDLPAEARAAGERIAALTGNEAACVTSGAAAGITLAVASVISGPTPKDLRIFPGLANIERNEILMIEGQRNSYENAALLTGATIVEVAGDRDSLTAAFGPRTACVLWFAGTQYPAVCLTLSDVVAVAHAHGVPVIVDAAAQIPPVSSLWHFTCEEGADAAIFSGGKGLRGPQTTGLVVGTRDIIEGCLAHASPNHGIGRVLKVGKEELAGFVAALEETLAIDEEKLLTSYEAIVAGWITELSAIDGIELERGYPSETGQPHGRAVITLDPGLPDAESIAKMLWDRNPRVAVLTLDDRRFALNPQPLSAGEEREVTKAVVAVLRDCAR